MRPWNNRDKIQATQPLSPRISSIIFGQISYDNMLKNWQKKELCSYFYVCWTECNGNYRKSLMRTPDCPTYIGLEVLYIIAEFLVKSNLVEFIITLLPKRLSIVFEGSILFSPFIVARSVATKHLVKPTRLPRPDLSGFAMIGREGDS